MAKRRDSYQDDYWGDFPPSKPQPVTGGIKAKTGRGKPFGKSWWASRWLAALEMLVDSGRLSRGRSYARSGQVLDIKIEPGEVKSSVQGSQRSPYKVEIAIKPLTAREWQKVIESLADQAIYAAKLLGGEMPQEIEAVFDVAGVPLFPTSRQDLVTDCSCPDPANPCKHIAAVYYILGERFDEDPFLIFRLRGRTKEQLIQELRTLRTNQVAEAEEAYQAEARAAEAGETAAPLEASLDHFWELQDVPPGEAVPFPVKIKPPAVQASLLKRLGPLPLGPRSQEIVETLAEAYALVTERAMKLAFGDDVEETADLTAETADFADATD